jgi:hypothetical protein
MSEANYCCVCGQPVYMVEDGDGPVVCVHHSPEFIMQYLGDGRPLNEWSKAKVAWAKKVLAGEIPLS